MLGPLGTCRWRGVVHTPNVLFIQLALKYTF
jgi:hypothetical protein